MKNNEIDQLLEKDLKTLKQAQEERDKDSFEKKEKRKKSLFNIKELVMGAGILCSVAITLFMIEKKHYILKKIDVPYYKKTITTSLGEEENYLQKEDFKELPYIKKYETITKEKGVTEQKVMMYYTDNPFPFSKEELFQMDENTLNAYFHLYNIETIENNTPLEEIPMDYTEITSYEEDWTHTYKKNESLLSYLSRILLLTMVDIALLMATIDVLYLSYRKRQQKRICDFSTVSSQEIDQMIQLTEQNRDFLTSEERERIPKILTKGSERR